MEVINTLMEQHNDIVDISVYIMSMLDIPDIGKRTSEIYDKVHDLTELIDKHMRLENDFLYNELSKHDNILVRGKVDMLRQEMGSIEEIYNNYANRWDSPEKIANGLKEFTKETLSTLKLLLRRLYNEDSDIYPLVERTNQQRHSFF